MTILSLVVLSSLGAAGPQQVLEKLEYADTIAARQAWIAAEGTPPADVAAADGRSVLRVSVPFAAQPKLSRVVFDRAVKLNLSAPGEFTLQVRAERPEAVGQMTLYFRSGDGWYGAGAAVTQKDWQQLHFSKRAFRTEGKPAGWHAIQGIRIAFWRGESKDTTIDVRQLTAVTHDVALVVPAALADRDPGEARAARDTADRIAGMLAEMGLASDEIDDTALANGALGDRRVVILPLNPSLGSDAAEAVARFVKQGGKVLVCYTLPSELGQVLGFRRGTFIQQNRPGSFAEIRFEAADIQGLPSSVKQASWNIITAEPAGQNSRVIGRWYDDAGGPTGHAAMLLSDAGAFLSHIVLSDDREGKKQMLAAVLGHLCPPLWQRMARSALDRAGLVGHCRTGQEVTSYVKSCGSKQAQHKLTEARTILEQAEKHYAARDYPPAAELARKAHDGLIGAYLLAHPSPDREGRAVWNHSGTGPYPGDWQRSAKKLADAGFNMVLPNMLWGGVAHYASDVLPRSEVFAEHGDQIAQCVAAAKRNHLEVHVWKVNWNLSRAPEEFVEHMRREGRTQVTVRGESASWLCPSHPENQKLELDSLLEVARKYDVDGLHFDYIRYPNRDNCYCDGCRQRFEKQTGRKVADWPKDAYSGKRREEYNDWRCAQITNLVAAVHREAKKIRPELKISAAVFGSYPACRESVAQDWVAWVKAGYLDFVCPMDYTGDDDRFVELVSNQLELVGGRIPVYPGIGTSVSRLGLTPDRTVGQIHHARRLGAAGFTVFEYGLSTAESAIPAVGISAGSRTAIPPHSTR